jgi:hypothetical protein
MTTVLETLQAVDKLGTATCGQIAEALGITERQECKNLAGVLSYLGRAGILERVSSRNKYKYSAPLGCTAVESHQRVVAAGVNPVKVQRARATKMRKRAEVKPVKVLGGVWAGLV